jgi:hypothetical protein
MSFRLHSERGPLSFPALVPVPLGFGRSALLSSLSFRLHSERGPLSFPALVPVPLGFGRSALLSSALRARSPLFPRARPRSSWLWSKRFTFICTPSAVPSLSPRSSPFLLVLVEALYFRKI